jgi:hypothetical protein
VSADLRSFEITRGRQYELNHVDPGSAQITLKNLRRQYDPNNTGGSYYPNVVPVVPIRLSATLSGTTYRLFTGYVARWPQNRTGPTYAETQIPCVDGFELLNQAVLAQLGSDPTTYAQELTGTRVTNVLNDAGWSSSARSIAAGTVYVPSYTFTSLDDVIALTHIQEVEDAEAGMFFVDGNGNAVFLDSHSLIQSPYTTSQATLTDKPSVDAGAIGYANITATIDKDLIYNDWRGTRSGGVTQIAESSSSITSYFRRTQVLTPLLTSDSDVMALMEYLNSQYSVPVLRFGDVTVTPGNSSAAWTQVLARELADRLTIKEHPPGGGSAITKDVHIQRLDLTVDLHAGNSSMVWSVLPADLTNYLILDSTTSGILDTSKLNR